MRVIGCVTSEQIISIIDHFTWKGVKCFKIELDNENVTNMREEDLRTMCP